jgi:hypothetical protein
MYQLTPWESAVRAISSTRVLAVALVAGALFALQLRATPVDALALLGTIDQTTGADELRGDLGGGSGAREPLVVTPIAPITPLGLPNLRLAARRPEAVSFHSAPARLAGNAPQRE